MNPQSVSVLGLAALIVFGSLSIPRAADADFSGGIETFDGTFKDTVPNPEKRPSRPPAMY